MEETHLPYVRVLPEAHRRKPYPQCVWHYPTPFQKEGGKWEGELTMSLISLCFLVPGTCNQLLPVPDAQTGPHWQLCYTHKPWKEILSSLHCLLSGTWSQHGGQQVNKTANIYRTPIMDCTMCSILRSNQNKREKDPLKSLLYWREAMKTFILKCT